MFQAITKDSPLDQRRAAQTVKFASNSAALISLLLQRRADLFNDVTTTAK